MGRDADDPTVIRGQQMEKDGIRNVEQARDTFKWLENTMKGRTTMKADVTLAEREAISNLLAVIHRDGGHYEAKHGLLKAIEDAEHIIVNERITLCTLVA